jgi:hypothetical protein
LQVHIVDFATCRLWACMASMLFFGSGK